MKKYPVFPGLLVMFLFLCLRQTSSVNVYTVKSRSILCLPAPPQPMWNKTMETWLKSRPSAIIWSGFADVYHIGFTAILCRVHSFLGFKLCGQLPRERFTGYVDPELIWCWSSSAGAVSAMQLAIVALMATLKHFASTSFAVRHFSPSPSQPKPRPHHQRILLS